MVYIRKQVTRFF